MKTMVKVKYVGPFDAVEVVGLVVKRDQTFEVDETVAGHPPEQRWTQALVELRDATSARPDHVRAARLRAELAGLDPGDGLLAQTDNFQPVNPGKAAKDGVK